MPVLRPFDPSRPLAASRNFRYSGDLYIRGDPFPQPGVDVPARKLKQLYFNRSVYYAGEETRRRIPYDSPNARAVAQRATGPAGVQLPTVKPEQTEAEQLADANEALAQKAERANTKDALLKKASGLAGVTKDQTKIEIARALVKAGRVSDGGDS